jgi:hypothetical protein
VRTIDLLDYAETVVGFPIWPEQAITVDAVCTGFADDGRQYETYAGSYAVVTAIKMLDHPDQLTIYVKIKVHEGADLYIDQVFSEADSEPQFPFSKILTPEELKAKAETAEKEVKAEAETKKDPPKADPHAVKEEFEDDWHQYYRGYC